MTDPRIQAQIFEARRLRTNASLATDTAILNGTPDPGRPQAQKPSAQKTPPGHYVNFYALDGTADLTVLMGDGPALLTGGDGGWQEQELWAAPPVTWWLAPTAYRQTIPLLFDGDSQEAAINDLLRLARSPGDRKPPPALMIAGPAVHRADLEWVVASVTSNDPVIRREGDGNRVRQGYSVELLQYSPIEILGQPAQRTRRRPRVKTWTVRAGDTLPRIAASSAVYGNANEWKRIAIANGIRDPRSLTVGRVLKIPA